VYLKDEIVAGATFFQTHQVAHAQYIAGNDKKNTLGSLDFLYHHLITKIFQHKLYFNFGISNENQGLNINQGLLFWKESFGGRSVVHDFYKINTGNYKLLEGVFEV